MRVTTERTVKAFIEGRRLTVNNTRSTGDTLELFGHTIAWREPNGDVFCTLAGWGTVTTRERLNGLFYMMVGNHPFHQANHKQFFMGQPVGENEIIKVEKPY